MREKLKRITWGTFAPAFYWWATYTLRGILWVVARWEVTGREKIPMTGPLIVVSNHLNNADPPILGSGIARRRIRFMAKVELWKYPMGVLVRLYDAFPVKRFESDLGAMLNSERILRRGGVIGMFPEGTRSRSGYIGDFHPGTAMIALRTGATILPCGIGGTEALRNPLVVFRKPRMSVHIGDPIAVERVKRPSEQQVSELTRRIEESVRALVLPKYLPPYTGNEGQAATNGADRPG